MNATDYLVWGGMIHLVVDWLLQNDWIASNKTRIDHPAAWIHSLVHACALSPLLGTNAAFLVGAVHMFIDTRIPLGFWSRVFRQTREGPAALHVAIWSDQVLHLLVVAIASLIVGR
jgi:hypothetical protein